MFYISKTKIIINFAIRFSFTFKGASCINPNLMVLKTIEYCFKMAVCGSKLSLIGVRRHASRSL